MPYTPPARSPAPSNANSPVLSRNHSYEGQVNLSLRPGLPRSRSAAYLQKHRRSPSIPQSPTTSTNGTCDSSPLATASMTRIEAVDHATGDKSTLLPQDLADEEDTGRGRQIQDLKNSLSTMVVQRRSSSPDTKDAPFKPKSAMKSTLTSRTGSPSRSLTPEARKIAHSRSSSEIQLSKLADVPSQAASSDESDDDEDLHIKPPLLRKKSGELVKPALRPSSRRRPSSMPGTPTFSKAVHFNEDIEQVRHFLQVDRPMAVSAGSSPAETYDSDTEYPFGKEKKTNTVEWEIRLSNFPTYDRTYHPCRVERIFLAADQKMLVGVVAVANIDYSKWVTARFTFDYWKTTSEVAADFNHDIRKQEANDGYDRFNFNIKLSDQANLESKTLLICIRYNVAGQEHWDNNGNMNYQIDFVKKVAVKKVVLPASNAGPLGSIPRSRRNAPATTLPRPNSFPSASDDEFNAGFEFGLLDSSDAWTRSRGRKNSSYPTQQSRSQQQHGGTAFSSRYDFGASLSTALARAAQDQAKAAQFQPKLGRSKTAGSLHTSIAPRCSAPAVQPIEGPTPKQMTSGRPELGSQEYHDLIQKFCYFGSKQGSPGTSSPDVAAKQATTTSATAASSKPTQTDGSQSPLDSDSDLSGPPSALSSASNSPPSERVERFQVDGTHDARCMSRSSTPTFNTASPRLIAQYRSPSPALGLELPFQVLAQ